MVYDTTTTSRRLATVVVMLVVSTTNSSVVVFVNFIVVVVTTAVSMFHSGTTALFLSSAAIARTWSAIASPTFAQVWLLLAVTIAASVVGSGGRRPFLQVGTSMMRDRSASVGGGGGLFATTFGCTKLELVHAGGSAAG